MPRPQPQPTTPPETDAQARTRNLDHLREMAELAMRAARTATDRITANDPEPGAPDPSLALARATHAARQAIALEQRIRAPAPIAAATRQPKPASSPKPLRPTTRDPRRAPLRDALHKAAKAIEPDRTSANQLCRMIDEQLDVELGDDPGGDTSITDILISIADELGITLDVAKLPDELIGMPPRNLFQDTQPRFEPRNDPPAPANFRSNKGPEPPATND